MTADLLLRAADKIRDATPWTTAGPWAVASTDGQGSAVHHGAHDTVALYASRPDAEHIALWHPIVALAVADWLTAEAKAPHPHAWDAARLDAATALARSILGEDPS